jgi:hypothetical protein
MVATGAVVLGVDSGPSLGGSCAGYVHHHTFITAAHCVPEGLEVFVDMPTEPAPRRVERIERHPTADLAVLIAERLDSDDQTFPLLYQPPPKGLIDGGTFIGFGYPVEGSGGPMPVGRLFRGHFQRYFGYTPPGAKESYFAGEMSIPAPAGFSGGPLAYDSQPQSLVAIVTTNHDSWAVVDRIEEVEKDGLRYREEVRRVISYGIAAILSQPVVDWLTDCIAQQ